MAYPEISSITINVNKRRDNVILGESNRTIWGSDSIMDTIGGIQFKISPQSFYQVNPIQTEKLYNRALSYAGLTGKETVWDLYCGIGTISLFMARHAKMVYGVEVVDRAVKDAAENARINGIKNARFITGKAEEILPEFYDEGGEKLLESFSGDDVDGSDRKNIKTDIYSSNENTAAEAINNNEKSVAEEARTPDVIVVDPPRKGLDAACIDTMIAMSPEKIVYVSCNPSTLARDLRMLADGGYKLMKYTPVDQFSRTVHVETVVLLSQQKPSDRIAVDLNLDELDATSAETKATYAEIKDYVLKEHGLKVSNLYISQVKRKCGLEVGENYNLAKSEDARQPNCPEEKERAIVDALGHFGMM